MQPPDEVGSTIRREPLSSADRRILAIVLAVAAVSYFYTWRNNRAAFPQASLQLTLSKEQITARAQAVLQARNWSTEGFRSITLFDPDDDARLFLEREAGLEEANRLMRSELPIWRWRARWTKPPRKEEFVVLVSPEGKLVGFDHALEETAPGANLSQEDARKKAEQFLAAQTSQPQRLIESKTEKRPNRTDHEFTFQRDGFEVKTARHRREIVVRGGEVAAYSEFLYVPESWTRDFAALRSKNELYQQIAQGLYVGLILAAVFVVLQALRRRSIDWHPLVIVCAAIGGLQVLGEWNNMPFYLSAMPTTTSYPEWILLSAMQGLGQGVGIFFYVILAAAAGEGLYRKLLPGKLSLSHAFTRAGLQTREFWRASLVGYGMAAGHIAFITAFYLIGQKFGVWSPQDVEHSNVVSTPAPWLYPLSISVLAASSEEFWFRLFAVPLLKRWTNSTVIAVVVPAFLWGFLHSNYPQQPGFVRGLEVGIIGIVAGIVMLRFGILATLVWHYTVDAALIGSFLLSAESWYFRFSGAAVAGAVAFPLLLSIWWYRRNGGFLNNTELLNESIPEPPEPAPRPVEEKLPALAPSWKPQWLYAAALVLAIAGWFCRPVKPGDFIQPKVTREQALQIAGPAEAPWWTTAEFVANLNQENFEYLRRLVGWNEANRIVRHYTATAVWRVRYFQPQKKFERIVYVSQEGRAFREDRVLDEKDPGANLTKEKALAVAEEYLRTRQQVKLEDYRLLDSSQQKRENRTDYEFVWENKSFQVGEAKARISMELLGDVPSGYRRSIKLPEEWQREFRKPRLATYLVPAVGGGVILLLLLVMLRRLSHHEFRWKTYAMVGLAGLLLISGEKLNDLSTFFVRYDTSQPISDFRSDQAIQIAIRLLMAGFVYFFGALGLDIFLNIYQGRRRASPFSPIQTAAIAACLFGVQRVSGYLDQLVPGNRYSLRLWDDPFIDTYSPLLGKLFSAGGEALGAALLVGCVVPSMVVLFSPQRRLGYAIVGSLCVALAKSDSPLLIAYTFLASMAMLGFVGFLARTSGVALASFAVAVFLLRAAG